METPTPEDDLNFCRDILRTASNLGEDEVCFVWFRTAKRKNQILEILNTRYPMADTSRIHIQVYH